MGATKQILTVGAAPGRHPELSTCLQRHGYEVLAAESPDEAIYLLARWKIACVVADAAMDQGPGPTMASRIARTEPSVAVVLLAERPDLRSAVSALHLGAMDYLPADAAPEEVSAAVAQAIDRRVALAEQHAAAQALRGDVASLASELRREREGRDRIALAAMESLVCVVEAKDLWLAGHSMRVAQMAASLAAELGRSDTEIEQVRLAGRLHDIGMVGVGDRILSKEGPLTPEEFDQVRAHVTLGSQILAPLPGMGSIVTFVRHHHERWDGEGYPDRLKAEEAPWGARLIGTAETYDALTTARPYRKPMAPDQAVQHMKTLIGSAMGPTEWRALAAVVGRREALVFLDDPLIQSSVSARASALHL
jgi:response regulator RpfG family c-di-GMP phosphodiesterase